MAEQRHQTACTVVEVQIARPTYRYAGSIVLAEADGKRRTLPMPGTIAQWLAPGAKCRLELPAGDSSDPTDYRLSRAVTIWPPFSKSVRAQARTAKGEVLYEYRVLAREAVYEADYDAIVELEQYHYASEKALLASWYCPWCRIYDRANLRPPCPRCDRPMAFHDLRDATRASRFLVFELENRASFEPRIVAYVRIDPPVPLMNRRLPDGTVVRRIREQVFPATWFRHPFRPDERVTTEQWWDEQGRALARFRSPVSRLARVVVHPDFRSDGLGQLAVKTAVDWIRQRRIPEMRSRKEAVETVAMMARYNPFLEKAGFRYVWDTGSGRPTLYLPLSERAEEAIETFLQSDDVARAHGGRLFRPRFSAGEPLAGPIRLEGVTKAYHNRVTVHELSEPVRRLLVAFGVEERVIQKYVLRDVTAVIEPGSVVGVVGASGAGKTTLLRLIIGAANKAIGDAWHPDAGTIELPENARVAALLPGELEPEFGQLPILEVIFRLCGDESLAVEVLNYVGIADVVLYRAPFRELSTGQKERAKLAYLLAMRPNLLVVDEFCAHLDPGTAARVSRRIAQLARRHKITLVAVTHRPEVLDALEPDQMYAVGYGTFIRLDELPRLGLRVLEPYASHIVEGRKKWELRKQPTRIRGRVGIVRGNELIGTVEVTDSHGPFTLSELDKFWHKHLADPGFLTRYAQNRKLYAWELKDPRKFDRPIPVRVRPGHQVWMEIEPLSTADDHAARSETRLPHSAVRQVSESQEADRHEAPVGPEA